MAKKTPARYTMIYDYVNQYYAEHSRYPSVRDIAAGTGISLATVHRYLKDMKESGEIEYDGRRSISTSQIEMDSPTHFMKVLGYVACGEGQEEEESVIEYIRMPESMVGRGDFFALISSHSIEVEFNVVLELNLIPLCLDFFLFLFLFFGFIYIFLLFSISISFLL